ncbi:MAG: hypothetical protein NWQ07_03925 [Flaviramulus sp.]|nr:hypothetical protein [Flaviramulus sp.]
MAIEKHSKLIKAFYIVGKKPKVPLHFKLKKYIGYQMIIHKKIDHPATETITKLNETHYQKLIELIKLL